MGNVRSMFGWDWVRVNAAALAVVVAIVGGLTSAIWYLGTLMGTLAPTASVAKVDEKVEALNVRVETLATKEDVEALDEKVEALNVRVETLATTDDVEALNVKVNQLQAMFPLMMSCIIEQNRQILVALAQDQLPVPELPASCETSLALAQAGATGR
ncbi:MAG: hypothetical protein OXQ28_15140 [Acidobacteriota bacterium]|nr:hypothetical protein [Acidobacteriota bacterium]